MVDERGAPVAGVQVSLVIKASVVAHTATNSLGILAAVTVQRVGTMLTPFFGSAPVRDFAAARRTDRAGYNAFFHAMLEGGVYLPPSAFEAAFTSAAHGDAELAAIEAALATAWRR